MFYMCETQTRIIKSSMLWSCSLENATPGNELFLLQFRLLVFASIKYHDCNAVLENNQNYFVISIVFFCCIAVLFSVIYYYSIYYYFYFLSLFILIFHFSNFAMRFCYF